MFFIIATGIVIFEFIIITKLLLTRREFTVLEKHSNQIKTPQHYADNIRQVVDGLHQIHTWNRPEFNATSTEIMTYDLADRLIEKLEELIKNS